MKERRGDVAKNERMHPDEAKARIIRFNEGGNLFDFRNEYLTIDHLRCICNSLVYSNHKRDFLYAVMHFANVRAPQNESHYNLYRREYKMLRRKANKLMTELNDEQPRLF